MRENNAQIHDNMSLRTMMTMGSTFYSGGGSAQLTGNTITDNNRSIRDAVFSFAGSG